MIRGKSSRTRRRSPIGTSNGRGPDRRRFLAILLGVGAAGAAAATLPALLGDDSAPEPFAPLLDGLPADVQVPAAAVFFWDDFARSDRNLDRDVAPTGQQYNIDFDSGDTQLWIAGDRMVRHVAANSGQTGSPSLVAPLLTPPDWIAARYVFTAAPGGSANPSDVNAVIGATDTDFADQSVQFAVYPTHCALFTTHTEGSDSGIITIIASDTYEPPLAQDGTTGYESVLTIDVAQSAVTIRHPGGVLRHRDPVLARYWGRNAHFQIRRAKDDSPDVQYLMIAAATPGYEPAPPPGGRSFFLHLPGTDGLSFPSCPALSDWTPSGDLDLRIKCRAASWTGNPEQLGQGLVSSWLPNGRRSWAWYVKPDRTTGFTIADATGANRAMGIATPWPDEVADDRWITLRLSYWNDYQASGHSRAAISYSLDDGRTWTEAGQTSKSMGTPGLSNGLAPIDVGNAALSRRQPNTFAGDVAWAEVYDGVNDGAAPARLLARLDASTVWARYSGTSGVFVDPPGNRWGLGGFGAIWQSE